MHDHRAILIQGNSPLRGFSAAQLICFKFNGEGKIELNLICIHFKEILFFRK